ncbi:hypothetical protein N869_07300 [Cellulomonas bogoriensis 69B4 = DSM 16987]|uniref:Tetratricopeptide repeat protein n=1 Tax=Cellulomonas bogoriensis 69B4 = DSM 16987 TaxID=1386082 RepID=A0A0A0BNV6_9CELL|nr:hypothetical protein N869_07300 [Cellulomonas bogoriensis 69B4 = DSM 16987]
MNDHSPRARGDRPERAPRDGSRARPQRDNHRGGSGRPGRPSRTDTQGPVGERRSSGPRAANRDDSGNKPVAPAIDDDVQASDLDRDVRSRLRTLSKDNADGVARHLVMAGRLLDDDPETAYLHAQAAVRRAGRVDVVREAAALAAYRTGRFAEALREFRTVRRLNGSNEHLALMADCERGLQRPERALALTQDDAARELGPDLQVELALVAGGARLDLGEPDAAIATLRGAQRHARTGEHRARLDEGLRDALVAAGRDDEAHALGTRPDDDEHIVVFDLEEDHPA